MSEKHETLAEFVSRVIAEKKLSFRKVAERTNGAISHSTVADIANGQRFDVKKDTLTAIAKGLEVPSDDVFRAARGLPISRTNRFDIYAERFDAQELTEREWEFIETYFADTVERFKLTLAHEKEFGPMIAAKLGPACRTAFSGPKSRRAPTKFPPRGS
jgi:transcriptional regulator with XRE-family HTH domain